MGYNILRILSTNLTQQVFDFNVAGNRKVGRPNYMEKYILSEIYESFFYFKPLPIKKYYCIPLLITKEMNKLYR